MATARIRDGAGIYHGINFAIPSNVVQDAAANYRYPTIIGAMGAVTFV